MSKAPKVERDPVSGALTIKCASMWYAFLAEEAYFEGDLARHDEFMANAEVLNRSPQGYLHSKTLEEHIKKWEQQ